MAIDVASGARRLLLDDPAADVVSPAISPDGTRVACVRETRSTPTAPIDRVLLVVPLHGGAPTAVAAGWDRWAEELCWTADGAALLVTADDAGRRPVFRVVPGAAPVRLTGDDGFYSDLVVAARRHRALRAAQRGRRPARPGAARPAGPRPAPGAAARPWRAA